MGCLETARARACGVVVPALGIAIMLGAGSAQAATCTGLPAFASCTAYANGASVTFGGARYTTIAAIPNNRDCPPNSPYTPATDNWWTNNGTCSGSATATATAGPGATATRTSAPTATPTTPSGGAINWSPWSLQLPDNTTANPDSTSNAWFYRDGSFQAFMDPKTGTTTSGSVHCRTELHENANWSSSGTNTLSATVKVTKIGSGKTTIAQVFSNNAHTLLELEYGTGGFTAFYEEAKGAGSSTDIGHAVGLGSTFTYKVAFSGQTLTVTINGATAWTKVPSSAGSSGTFYFKAGNYDQSATSGPVSTTAYSIVEFSALSVSH
jgi:Alginate lyase